jgi:hypothetical protein
VKDMTPEEAWSDLKPTVHYFRVFGCIAYAHVPDAQRKKLEGIKCVHLGVSNESKGYKLFDPSKNKVIISKDVVFEEEKGWDWNEKHKEPSLQADINDDSVEEDAAVHIEGNTNNNDSDESSDDTEENVQSGSNNEENEETARIRKPPVWSKDYVIGREAEEEECNLQNLAFFSSREDPATYEEAAKLNCWREAMDQEIEAIERNDTWELVDLPVGSRKIGVKWIYKTKYNENGKVEKHKARLVAKGYSQKYGVDYNEVFAPVARWDTIRTILVVAASNDWKVYQLDVKSAFLHGELLEDV